MKKFILLTLTSMALLASIGCGDNMGGPAVGLVAVSPESKSMLPGTTYQLTATVIPDNAEHNGFEWVSGDEAVATVSSAGLVTAIANGSTTISASAGGKTGHATIIVNAKLNDVVAQSVSFSAAQYVLSKPGEKLTLQATVIPVNTTDKTLTFSSADHTIATVDASTGEVTGVAAGKTEITVTTHNGKTATAELYVDDASLSVYVIGNTQLPGYGNRLPTLWKNALPNVQYSTESGSNLTDLAVSESGDLYVVGWDKVSSDFFPCIWKNGQRTRLGDKRGDAMSLFIDGQDVYVAGYTYSDTGDFRPVVWKNGEPIQLPMGTNGKSAYALNVYVSGGSVYVVGFQVVEEAENALLWKDGQVEVLSQENTEAQDVYVEGNNVYVVGRQLGGELVERATLWHNGQISYLDNVSSKAYSILGSGSDIYISGVSVKGVAPDSYYATTVWKNGVKEVYDVHPESSPMKNSMFILDGDLYVTGTKFLGYIDKINDQRAGYFLNGKWHQLEQDQISTTIGIWVVKK